MIISRYKTINQHFFCFSHLKAVAKNAIICKFYNGPFILLSVTCGKLHSNSDEHSEGWLFFVSSTNFVFHFNKIFDSCLFRFFVQSFHQQTLSHWNLVNFLRYSWKIVTMLDNTIIKQILLMVNMLLKSLRKHIHKICFINIQEAKSNIIFYADVTAKWPNLILIQKEKIWTSLSFNFATAINFHFL